MFTTMWRSQSSASRARLAAIALTVLPVASVLGAWPFPAVQRINTRCALPAVEYRDREIAARDSVSGRWVAASPTAAALGAPKRFEMVRDQLTAQRLVFERVGVTVLPNGELLATGVLTHLPTDDGSLVGANGEVVVRGYGAATPEIDDPTDPVLLWEQRRRFWIDRGATEVLSLNVPMTTPRVAEQRRRETISVSYQRLTHVEVVLILERDL